jgi:twitching motility protein PilT
MNVLKPILQHLVDTKADSIQLRPGQQPYLYHGDAVAQTHHSVLDENMLEDLARSLLDPSSVHTFSQTGRARGRHAVKGVGHFEFGIRRTDSGVAIALRQVTDDIAPTAANDALSLVVDNADFVVRDESLMGILRAVLEFHVSDCVMSSGRPTRVRIGGQYRPIPWAVFNPEEIKAALGDNLTDERRDILEKTGSLDVAVEIEDESGLSRRFRCNVFQHLEGIATAWRPIWDSVPNFKALMLPKALIELAELPYGLVLITGPTGSGKSTTLSALIEHINQNSQKHIITLEDPIEYRFRDKQSVIHQREVGVHTDSFSKGLRAALREAPDVILVGEMRDLDTISAALTAAETGHLVLSTLHSGHSAQAIDRIIDVFPENQQQQVRVQLADVLRAIVTQRLLPTIDGVNRVPAVEVVNASYAVANTIRDGRTHQLINLIQSGKKDGMIAFETSLAHLVNQGLITESTASRCARDQSFLRAQIKTTKSDSTLDAD